MAGRPAHPRFGPYSLSIATGTVFGLGIACLIVQPIWNDQAWLLYSAQQLMQGDRLYVDLLETNPPLIVWLSTIPVAMAQLMGTTSLTGLTVSVALLAVCICVWCLYLYASADQVRRSIAPWVAIVLVYATIVQPSMHFLGGLRTDFAQREHIVTLFLMPYLFGVARWLDGRPLSRVQGILIGLSAAVSLSLKPYNVLIVVCVEALLLYRCRRISNLFRAELIAMGIGGMTYCGAVWLFTPAYVTETIPLMTAMYRYFDPAPLAEMLGNHKSLVVKAVVTLVWLTVLRLMHRTSRVWASASVLSAAAVGAFAAFLAQGKDWSDHTLPAQIFVHLALAMLALDQILHWINRRFDWQRANLAAATLVTIVVCSLVVTAYFPVRAAALEGTQLRQELNDLNSETADLPAGSTILVLTPGIEFQFYFALTRQFVWGSKSPCAWLQASIANAESAPSDSVGDASRVALGKYTDLLLSSIRSDFDRWHPSIVLVLRCADLQCNESLDLVNWFSSRDATFAKNWSHYVWVKRIGRFDFFRRDEAGILSK